MEKNILVSHIQRFSLHDGPGIRTTVFLKGCYLRCPWCSNPENLLKEQQQYSKNGITNIYGKWYSAEELVDECLKDKLFYQNQVSSKERDINNGMSIDELPGGVTFSGGEPLMQIEELQQAIKTLRENGIHIATETSLYVPENKLIIALPFIDLFYVDVKILDIERAKTVENGNLECYLDNLKTLVLWRDESLRKKPLIIRIPVIGGMTDDDRNRERVHELLETYRENILKIELIKEHFLGEEKYKSLNIEAYHCGVSDELMEMYGRELSDLWIPIEICCV